MPDVQLGKVQPEEALKYLRSKQLIPTEHWDSLMGESHAKGFTIAGATKHDLLKDFQSSLVEMMDKGLTLQDFRQDFDQIVARHGWTYNGSQGWRTAVIYNTNMGSSLMAGKWAKIQATKEAFPYLQYDAVNDGLTRELHLSWDGIVRPVDDSFWDTHYPLNGYGCRCNARQLSQTQLDREGLSVSPPPPINMTPRTNTRTGEYYGETPEGIDTGFGFNAGKAWLGPDIKFGEQLMQIPSASRERALHYQPDYLEAQTESWQGFLDSTTTRGTANGTTHSVGYLPTGVLDAIASKKGIQPSNALITIIDHDLPHLAGAQKAGKVTKRNRSGSDKSLPVESLVNLPMQLMNYQAVLWDKEHESLLVVLKGDAGGKKGRAVVAIDVRDKGQRGKVTYNTVRSIGVEQARTLKDAEKYELLDGEL